MCYEYPPEMADPRDATIAELRAEVERLTQAHHAECGAVVQARSERDAERTAVDVLAQEVQCYRGWMDGMKKSRGKSTVFDVACRIFDLMADASDANPIAAAAVAWAKGDGP